MRSRRALLVASTSAAFALSPAVAAAQSPAEPAPATPSPALPAPAPAPPAADRPAAAPTVDPIDAPAEHRSGVVFGLGLGVGLLDVSGHANSASHLADPAYANSTGPSFGIGNRFFLMGALADTFNFGLWFGGMSGENATTKMSASGGGFRAEAFPLYSMSPRLRDLGFVAQFGVGHAIADKKDGSLSIDGTSSLVGAGALYELTRNRFIGLKASSAVTLDYQYIFAPSIESHGVFVGARIAFYGGP
ncbi:MAG: hypothetical protein U0235_32825 [Polyangiaceae bacterium]